jgi:hypothetical protein
MAKSIKKIPIPLLRQSMVMITFSSIALIFLEQCSLRRIGVIRCDLLS